MGRTRVYFSAGVRPLSPWTDLSLATHPRASPCASPPGTISLSVSQVFEMLESMRGGVIFTHIKCIQRVWRGSRMRKLYYKMRRSGALLKRVLQGWKHRRRFWRLRKAVVALQTRVRARIARRVVSTLRRFTYTVRLQSWARMVPRRRLFLRMRRAARLIGRWMKVKYFKKLYKTLQLTNRENKRMSVQLDKLKVSVDTPRQDCSRCACGSLTFMLHACVSLVDRRRCA